LILFIQIPCFNEETTLPATIGDLPREVGGFDRVEWLVIDDGSTDRTAEVARECGVDHVVSHDSNRGLAAAYMTGLDAALKLGADVIVNTDADNQYDAKSIDALTAPIVNGAADMVVGERPIKQIQEFSKVKKWLQRLGSKVVRVFSGTDVRDAASGFRAISRKAALRLRVFGNYTYTMETLIQAGWEGLGVQSVPVGVNPKTRESRLVKSIPQYVFRSAATIIRSFALYKPFRFFFSLSAPFWIAGTIVLVRWSVLFLTNGNSMVAGLVVGCVLILIALQIVLFAFLADLMAASRRISADLLVHYRKEEVMKGNEVIKRDSGSAS